MLPLFLAFLPLVSSFFPFHPPNTYFVYSGNVICTTGAEYKVDITLLELDAMTPHEVLHTMHLEGVNEQPVFFNFTAFDDDDGYLDDRKFELTLQIAHTCNSVDIVPGPLQFRTEVIEVPVDGKVHSINVPDIYLTNRGDRHRFL